jgi:hypothetical protein
MMQKKTCREKLEADAYISESAPDTEKNNLDSPTQQANEVDNSGNSGDEMGFEIPGNYVGERLHSRSPIPGVQAAIDEDDETSRWIEEFPRPAGVPIGEGVSSFEKWRRDQVKNNEPPWSPFESREEWELAQWLIASGISQKKIDSFLKQKTVRVSQTETS